MPVPETIKHACGYLRQLENIEESPKVQIPEGLVEELEITASDAQAEITSISIAQSLWNVKLTKTGIRVRSRSVQNGTQT